MAYDPGILGVKTPEKSGCQELLTRGNLVHHGWLRKKGLINKLQFKLLKWPQQYVIVGNRCLYYYDSETSKQPAGAVSLYGFNRIIRATPEKAKDVLWAFKMEHVQPQIRSHYFAASSEKEMITWMKAIKTEMFLANNMEKRLESHKSLSDGASLASSGSWESSEYKDLEASIYNEPVNPRMSAMIEDDGDGGYGEIRDVHDDNDRAVPSAPPYSLSKNITTVAQGYSLQKMPLPGYNSADDSGQTYWDAIHFDGDKVRAAEVINKISEVGVYLVRKSEDGSNVLVVFVGRGTRKYRILVKESGQVALTAGGPYFESLEDLLYHYYDNSLPNVDQTLTMPYKLHDKYKNA